ncbi:tyrosine-protein phosphatase [Microbacterium sp. C7(2022)]|uniref:tyrosine-protein phosphatase n=1 Tax=Microbacterium sp. C7(2022) TaxID=2992759 RepID=UPI00237B5252|nr:tyrosine-protein phosphatase [Microbacterium sp. C7(2022)]MDE0546657.1 tyrosine-protein phosphatase [Microbacterium sp. C7(2022)]
MTITLPASPLTNLRDLGGIAVAGGYVRAGVVLRADDVALIDADSAEALIADGLGLVIDLRSPGEAERTGRGVLEQHPVDYLHLPLTQEVADPRALALFAEIGRAADPERAMGTWYATLVRERSADIVRGIEVIAGADTAVVFHCAAGKDRTGVFAASILSVLGADRAEIVADYTRTGENLPALLARIAATTQAQVEASGLAGMADRVPHVLMSAPAAAMEAMLDDLDADGGLAAVLREAGLGDDTIERLRERAVVAQSA